MMSELPMMSRLIIPCLLAAVAMPLTAQVPHDSVVARLDRDFAPYLRDLAGQDRFSGIVVVAKNGVPFYHAEYGMADKSASVSNTTDMRFNLGSMDKMFTAIAIAQLVESRRVWLDSTVGTYLRAYPNRDVASNVTVRQLLTHTSGLGDYFIRGYPENGMRINRAADLLQYFVMDSLAFRPGARMSYSNAGFAVLGAIIEQVSGESYFDYVQRHIFLPAGMMRSGFEAERGSTAIGYTRRGPGEGIQGPDTGARHPNTGLIEARGGPAGGGYSTAHDLIAFARSLWSGKLVSRALVDEFTTGKVTMGPVMKYAFGFGDLHIGSTRIVGHNGGAKGVNAEFDSYPDLGYDVVVLTNYDPPVASAVIQRIRRIIAPQP
jgi:D-alanyl-D-alanine carboxypeptidase